jgi:predicted Rdx family selenoprotein
VKVVRSGGKLGQFDVVVDGEVIASRKPLWQRGLGGGWPDPEEVVAKIEAKRARGDAPK